MDGKKPTFFLTEETNKGGDNDTNSNHNGEDHDYFEVTMNVAPPKKPIMASPYVTTQTTSKEEERHSADADDMTSFRNDIIRGAKQVPANRKRSIPILSRVASAPSLFVEAGGRSASSPRVTTSRLTQASDLNSGGGGGAPTPPKASFQTRRSVEALPSIIMSPGSLVCGQPVRGQPVRLHNEDGSSTQMYLTQSPSSPHVVTLTSVAKKTPRMQRSISAGSLLSIRTILQGSESQASGSARVTTVQQRRRQVPNKHPHRKGRNVSAPAELQPHLGPHSVHPNKSKHTKGSAITDPTDSSQQEYIININSGNTHVSEELYSRSDSGVTSEYPSWSVPVSGHQRQDQSVYEDDLTSPAGSVKVLLNENSRRRKVKYFSSDSVSESVGMNSPLSSCGRGMSNPGYVNIEPKPVVLSVDGPPPRKRSLTDSNLLVKGMQGMPGSSASAHPSGRSVSLLSLNPNLSGYSNDTQSIYSEIGSAQYGTGYLGAHHIGNVMGSQCSLAGLKNHSMGGVSSAPMPDGEEGGPQPTPEDDKKQWTINTLIDSLSLIYAIFMISLGVVIYLADTFIDHDSAMAQIFNCCLIIVQLLWLGYVHIDVRQYLQRIMKAMREEKKRNSNEDDQVVLEPTGDGQYQLRINLPEPRKTIPQHYGFTSGRHGGSLYLKIGATVFCLGHLIHSGLNLGQKILYLTADDPASVNCTNTPDVLMSVLEPIYSFYNLFFLFKYSNLIINRRKLLSRFGLMHCISASLCFWIYTIIRETLQAIYSKTSYTDNLNETTTATPIPVIHGDDDDDDMMKKAFKQYAGKSVSDSWTINYDCEHTTELTEMINYTTPYLYPFSIEYNILIVGVWILLWENIGKTERHTHIPSVEVTYEEDNTKGFSSNMIIYVDCHSSNRGLFAGLLITVATVISIILFFIFTSSQNNVQLGLYVNGYSELVLLLLMGVTAVLAYNSVRHLDIIKHGISNVDDILLIICLPCILLFAFFSIAPSIRKGDVLFASVHVLEVLQVILQTVLIGDGLRRCANSSTLQQKKPGREVVTFLVVANVAMWLLETFEIKSDAANQEEYDLYGKILWILISHMTLPLVLFYRFHSSVCLADIWKASYEPEPDH